jgi:hypothetical protein
MMTAVSVSGPVLACSKLICSCGLTVHGTGCGRELYLQYQRRKVEALEDERIKFEISTIGHVEVRAVEPRVGSCIFNGSQEPVPLRNVVAR